MSGKSKGLSCVIPRVKISVLTSFLYTDLPLEIKQFSSIPSYTVIGPTQLCLSAN